MRILAVFCLHLFLFFSLFCRVLIVCWLFFLLRDYGLGCVVSLLNSVVSECSDQLKGFEIVMEAG